MIDLADFCTGLDDGDYRHPDDCTKYITCNNELAYERSCPSCHVDPVNCPDGKLNWDDRVRRCEWVDIAQCSPPD